MTVSKAVKQLDPTRKFCPWIPRVGQHRHEAAAAEPGTNNPAKTKHFKKKKSTRNSRNKLIHSAMTVSKAVKQLDLQKLKSTRNSRNKLIHSAMTVSKAVKQLDLQKLKSTRNSLNKLIHPAMTVRQAVKQPDPAHTRCRWIPRVRQHRHEAAEVEPGANNPAQARRCCRLSKEYIVISLRAAVEFVCWLVA